MRMKMVLALSLCLCGCARMEAPFSPHNGKTFWELDYLICESNGNNLGRVGYDSTNGPYYAYLDLDFDNIHGAEFKTYEHAQRYVESNYIRPCPAIVKGD
jgi:hypothetical protein